EQTGCGRVIPDQEATQTSGVVATSEVFFLRTFLGKILSIANWPVMMPHQGDRASVPHEFPTQTPRWTMKLLHGFCCLVLGIAFLTASGQTGQGGKYKDKDKSTDETMVVGKVKVVNLARNNFTITLESGKDRTFGVDKKTKFLGPQGGKSKDGLKDD